MKNTKRSTRRHHYSRIKSKRVSLNYWGRVKLKCESHEQEWDNEQLGISVNTPTICSLPDCCGNLRARYGITLQEKRSILSEKEWKSM